MGASFAGPKYRDLRDGDRIKPYRPLHTACADSESSPQPLSRKCWRSLFLPILGD